MLFISNVLHIRKKDGRPLARLSHKPHQNSNQRLRAEEERKDMNMTLHLIGLVVLMVLYGLAWHDRPAHELAPLRRTTRKH
jgi:hypothetical protein